MHGKSALAGQKQDGNGSNIFVSNAIFHYSNGSSVFCRLKSIANEWAGRTFSAFQKAVKRCALLAAAITYSSHDFFHTYALVRFSIQ